jgi:hypothetical protein
VRRLLLKSELRWFVWTVALTLIVLVGFSLLRVSAKTRQTSTAAVIHTAGNFTFSTPSELVRPISPIFFQQGGEPEIKIDIFGNIYVTAIQGVPGGVDLWKSTDGGNTPFPYLGQPDGAQDKCPTIPQCAGLGGGDDSIDVSPGGYLYVSSLWIGNVTVSTSMDGGTGGVQAGQAWQVNPAAASVVSDDRQWIAAYGAQTLNMTYRQAPGTGDLFFVKSTDAGKTFGAPVLVRSGNSTEGNLVVDPYNGNLYTTTIPANALNQIHLLKSTDGGATWAESTAYTGAAGANPAHKFTILAVDRGGNVHLVFSESNASGFHVYLTSSIDQGASWLAAVQVDSGTGDTVTAVMPWVAAGSPGIVDITWLGSPAASPVQSNWHVFFAQTTNAFDPNPTFAENEVETAVMHDQDICFNGSGCAANPSASPGNRDLLEYYTMTLDPDGFANIAYSDSVNNCDASVCITNAWFTKQTAGPSAYAPPAPPASATFAANISVGSPGAEPGIKVDLYNCIYITAPGNPWVWKSIDNGTSFPDSLRVNPVADEPTLTGGDEDILTLPQATGLFPDQVYFADLGISSVHIRKSIDGGATWAKPGTGGAAGDVSVSSDRQWLAGDRGTPTAPDQVVYEWDHELSTETMRLSALVNDTAWQTTSGMTNSEFFSSPTFPNTNPGPVFVDNMAHTVYALFAASIPTTNAANPPFGKLLNLWDAVGPPPAAAGVPAGPFTNYSVFKGVIDSPTTPAPPAGTTTFGTTVANIFPAGAIDSSGNIYVAWSMNNARTNEFSIWFASSHDNGKTFYGPFPVSTGPLVADETAVFPWIAAGDNGRVDIVWYQSNTVGDSNTIAIGAAWNVMMAQSLNANSREPVFTVSQVSDHVMHMGPISTGGLIGSADRSLLDFFQVAIGPDGLANIVYADNGSTSTHAEFARQNGGPLAKANPTSPACIATTPTPTPTATPPITPTPTPTPTPPVTPTPTPTATPPITPTPTPTPTPPITPTPTPTATPPITPTPTPTPTPGGTPGPTPTPTPTPTPAGTPTPTPTPTPTATPTPTPTPAPTPVNVQLLNISGRVFAETGENIGIGGFIISGSSNKSVIIRAIGPSMQVNGVPVPGTIQDPVLELHTSDGRLIRADDNWRDTQEQQIQNSGLAPTDDRESAIIGTLPPGNYTAQIAGKNNTTGIGLVEIYDLNSTQSSELGNLSVRANVLTGDNVLIDGLILRGGNPKRVLFRAIGPELTAQGVANALQDPTLELHDGNGNLLRSNDNWRDAPNAAEIQATGLAPTDDRESAILLVLTPGNYTAIVRGVNDTTGVALAEAYKLTN